VSSVLLVAQLAPPSPLIAARRAGAMAKYLSRNGVEVTMLTSRVSGEGPIEGAAEVVRTADLLASPLNWRRRHLAALVGETAGTYSPASMLESVLVPDPGVVSWLPFALPAASRLARRSRFDCVITTSPPQSAHVVGRALKRRGLCWIAELRDGWTFEPPHAPWPSRPQRAFDRGLERRLLSRADAVVAVTEPIAVDARDRLGVEAHVITNGFDPEEVGEREPDPLLRAGVHSFVHTGRVGVTGTRLEPLLAALRQLAPDSPPLEVVFAGSLSEDEARQLAAPELNGLVRVVGSLERGRALKLQRSAHTLLVITEGNRRRSVATGKLFEYLAAGPPILVLGDETEAARIVRETGTGEAASATDPAAIATALRRFAGGESGTSRDPEALEEFSWARLATRYAELIARQGASARAPR
jgi:glycosyltransferase involved in cell wall biosynthesis